MWMVKGGDKPWFRCSSPNGWCTDISMCLGTRFIQSPRIAPCKKNPPRTLFLFSTCLSIPLLAVMWCSCWWYLIGRIITVSTLKPPWLCGFRAISCYLIRKQEYTVKLSQMSLIFLVRVRIKTFQLDLSLVLSLMYSLLQSMGLMLESISLPERSSTTHAFITKWIILIPFIVTLMCGIKFSAKRAVHFKINLSSYIQSKEFYIQSQQSC